MHLLKIGRCLLLVLAGCEQSSTVIVVEPTAGEKDTSRDFYWDGNSVAGSSERGAFAIKNDGRAACYSIADARNLEPLCIE